MTVTQTVTRAPSVGTGGTLGCLRAPVRISLHARDWWPRGTDRASTTGPPGAARRHARHGPGLPRRSGSRDLRDRVVRERTRPTGPDDHERSDIAEAAIQAKALDHVNLPTQPPLPGAPVGVLAIPALGINQAVVEGVGSSQTVSGPGHVPGTAGLGQPGNAAVVGRNAGYGGRLRPARPAQARRPDPDGHHRGSVDLCRAQRGAVTIGSPPASFQTHRAELRRGTDHHARLCSTGPPPTTA